MRTNLVQNRGANATFYLSVDFKLEFYDDVYKVHEDREKYPMDRFRRAAAMTMTLISTVFLLSVM